MPRSGHFSPTALAAAPRMSKTVRFDNVNIIVLRLRACCENDAKNSVQNLVERAAFPQVEPKGFQRKARVDVFCNLELPETVSSSYRICKLTLFVTSEMLLKRYKYISRVREREDRCHAEMSKTRNWTQAEPSLADHRRSLWRRYAIAARGQARDHTESTTIGASAHRAAPTSPTLRDNASHGPLSSLLSHGAYALDCLPMTPEISREDGPRRPTGASRTLAVPCDSSRRWHATGGSIQSDGTEHHGLVAGSVGGLTACRDVQTRSRRFCGSKRSQSTKRPSRPKSPVRLALSGSQGYRGCVRRCHW